jgi:hypothetical protein
MDHERTIFLNGPFMIRKLLVFLPESKTIFKILPECIEKSKTKRGDNERTHPVYYKERKSHKS